MPGGAAARTSAPRPAHRRVTGRVTDEAGRAWPGPFWILAGPACDDGRIEPPTGVWRFPAGDGCFSLDLGPGPCRLIAGADGRPPSDPVAVADDAAAVRLVLPEGRTLRGRLVLAADGLPLPHLEIVARTAFPFAGPDAPSAPSTFTAADGSFTWTGVPFSSRYAEVRRAGAVLGTVPLPELDGGDAVIRLDLPDARAKLDTAGCK